MSLFLDDFLLFLILFSFFLDVIKLWMHWVTQTNVTFTDWGNIRSIIFQRFLKIWGLIVLRIGYFTHIYLLLTSLSLLVKYLLSLLFPTSIHNRFDIQLGRDLLRFFSFSELILTYWKVFRCPANTVLFFIADDGTFKLHPTHSPRILHGKFERQ